MLLGKAVLLNNSLKCRPCALYALYEGHRGKPGSGWKKSSNISLSFDHSPGSANVCAEFCAPFSEMGPDGTITSGLLSKPRCGTSEDQVKQLHQKLLPKLSAFRGFWEAVGFCSNSFRMASCVDIN